MSDLVKMSDIINIYNTYDSEEAREQVMKLPSINAVIIPDNATNGDVIKALFSIQKEKYTEYDFIKVYGLDSDTMPVEFLTEWWNASYKLSKLNM